MKITDEVLQIIEDKIWGDLESVNDYEKQLIKNKSTIKHNINHFSDSHRYIIYIDMLQNLKHLINDDETYIEYYGLEEFKTEEKVEECKKECRIKEEIKALSIDYQNKLNELLVAGSISNNGGLYGKELFSTAHYLESGIETLNVLRERLED